jgi:hypothetical protein
MPEAAARRAASLSDWMRLTIFGVKQHRTCVGSVGGIAGTQYPSTSGNCAHMKAPVFVQFALLIGFAIGAVGCRTTRPGVRMATSVIGDDICAVGSRLDIRVTDPGGTPIEGAELWEIDEPHLQPPEPTRARLRGSSDAPGQIDLPDCLMGNSEFSRWQLTPTPVNVVLLVVREGYGSRRIVLNVPASDVLAASDVSGVPNGVPFSLSETGKLGWSDPGYRLSASVTLVPVASERLH